MKRQGLAPRAFARFTITIIFALFPLAAAPAEDRITLSEAEWAAEAIPEGRLIQKRITVGNGGKDALQVEIASDTQRLTAEPASLRLGPGESAAVNLYFDTNGSTGGFAHRLTFQAAGGAGAEKTLSVSGTVDSSAKTEELAFFFYYAFNCHQCQVFLNETVPGLERKLGVRLAIQERDVLDPAQLALFKRKMKQLGQRARELPAVIVGDTAVQGYGELDRDLERILGEYLAGTRREARAGDLSGVGVDDALAVIPVFAAGLLDGINPCVFSTLIFLLAYLAFAGKTKKQILLIGVVYSLTVFVSYFLIGLGFFRVIYAASAFPVVALAIQIILLVVLILFAALSLHDFIKIKQNRMKDIKLQLPNMFKERIRKTIRAQAASVTIVASSIVIAFAVTVFELACTGQIYFPTIAALVQTRRNVSDFIYLGVYNLAFVAPLLLVFFLTYRGLSSQKLTAFFQKHLGLVKILTFVLFLGLAVYVSLTLAPLILSFAGK